jgi:DNA-binding transcriptional MerR regulator
MNTRTIAWLAAAAGVPISTVRYYERQQVLAPPDRSDSGYRRYGEDDLQQLQLVLRAKLLGFSLAEIIELFGTGQHRSAAEIRLAAGRKRSELRRRIAQLTAITGRLEQLAVVCDIGDPAQCADLKLDVHTDNVEAS